MGGLATITHHLLGGAVDWGILMVAFNLPIFVLVSALIDKKMGLMLSIYMIVQSFVPRLYGYCGLKAYCLANNAADFNIIFVCITTEPEVIAEELMRKRKYGVTKIAVQSMHTHTERYMPVCIINKRQIGDMMRIIKKHPGTFANFEKVNEAFGNFKRNV